MNEDATTPGEDPKKPRRRRGRRGGKGRPGADASPDGSAPPSAGDAAPSPSGDRGGRRDSRRGRPEGARGDAPRGDGGRPPGPPPGPSNPLGSSSGGIRRAPSAGASGGAPAGEDRAPRGDRPARGERPQRADRPQRSGGGDSSRDRGRGGRPDSRPGSRDSSRDRDRPRSFEPPVPQDENSIALGAAFRETQIAIRDARKALAKRKAEFDDEPEWMLTQLQEAEARFEAAATAWSEHLETTGRKVVRR